MNRLRAMWQKSRKVLLPLGCALVLVCVVGALVIAASTSSNTNAVVNQHNADLSKIKHLSQRILVVTNQVHTLQAERSSELQTIQSDATAIEGYAVTLKQEIADNHGVSYQVLVSLCELTPGCVVPPS